MPDADAAEEAVEMDELGETSLEGARKAKEKVDELVLWMRKRRDMLEPENPDKADLRWSIKKLEEASAVLEDVVWFWSPQGQQGGGE